jgi:hypothetical protein
MLGDESVKYFSVLAKCIYDGAYKATKYISENETLKATRRRYKGKIMKGKCHPVEILFTVGRPNYLERDFIKACKKAGEPFPIKKIQLKYPKT